MIRSYTVDDDLALSDRAAIEVTITLADEQRRWCFFMTPAALASVGDSVEGTRVRAHVGETHMIVVSQLSRDIIERVLRQLDRDGELLDHTRPLGKT